MYLYTIAEYEISHKTTYQNDSWYVPGDCKMFVPSYVKLCNTIFYSHIQLFCSRHLLAVVETPSFTEPHSNVRNRLGYVHLREETPCLWKIISTIAQAVDHKQISLLQQTIKLLLEGAAQGSPVALLYSFFDHV